MHTPSPVMHYLLCLGASGQLLSLHTHHSLIHVSGLCSCIACHVTFSGNIGKMDLHMTLLTSLLLHLHVQTVPHAVPLHGQGALNTAYTNLPLNIHVCSA